MPSRILDEFYVGYLAMPRGHRRFLTAAIPACLTLMLASALALAFTQPAPGLGVWDIDAPVSLTGDLHATPYPMLRVSEPAADAGLYLLVQPGKLGAAGVVAPHDALPATVRGYLLHRDGRRIIELDAAASALAVAPAAAPTPPPEIAWQAERVTLSGEILDAKCYIGAMKPGHGRGHKACAITCIQGGIPPVLVTATPQGPAYHLLVDQVGAPLTDEALATILPIVAEFVSVTGRPGRLGEWHVLAIDPAAVAFR